MCGWYSSNYNPAFYDKIRWVFHVDDLKLLCTN